MLTTCANPSCREPFRYLRDGRLFRLQTEVKGSSSEISDPEYFWLCARCAETMSLRLAEDRQVVVVSAPETHSAQATEPDFIPLDRCGARCSAVFELCGRRLPGPCLCRGGVPQTQVKPITESRQASSRIQCAHHHLARWCASRIQVRHPRATNSSMVPHAT